MAPWSALPPAASPLASARLVSARSNGLAISCGRERRGHCPARDVTGATVSFIALLACLLFVARYLQLCTAEPLVFSPLTYSFLRPSDSNSGVSVFKLTICSVTPTPITNSTTRTAKELTTHTAV